MTGGNNRPTKNCHVLRMYDPFGKPVDLKSCDIFSILVQPLNGLYVLLAIASFVAVDALALTRFVSFPATVFIWSVTIPLHVAVYLALDLGWAWGQSRLPLPRIWMPSFGLVAYAVNTAQVTAQLAWLSDRSFTTAFTPELALLGIPMAVIFNLFFFAFVLPVLREQHKARTAAAPRGAEVASPRFGRSQPAQPRSLLVGGNRIAIDTVLLLRSQEHYVQIVTSQGSDRIRARLGDLVDQTRPEDGVLAHRSYWVAARAILAVSGPREAPETLMTVFGEELPIARPRRAEVGAWLDETLPGLPDIRTLAAAE